MNSLSIAAMLSGCCLLAACNDKIPPWSETPAAQAPAEVAVVPWTATADATNSGHCNLDTVNAQPPSEGITSVALHQPVSFEGWLATAVLTNPGNFTFVLDGSRDFGIQASASLPRGDVAKQFKSRALTNSGFKIDLDARSVPAGIYTLKFAYRLKNAEIACNTGVQVEFK